MASNKTLLDGRYSAGFYVGRPAVSYPFAANGDYETIMVTSEWRQSAATFAAGTLGEDTHPSYPTAVLIFESPVEPVGNGDAIRCTRIFATVPSTQTVPTSLRVSKPSFSGTFPQEFGPYLIHQPDTSRPKLFDAYQRLIATSDAGTGTSGPTGGTYTLSFGGYTTSSLAYNASASTVQSALNALASVTARGGVTVTGDYAAGFTITFAEIFFKLSADISALVISDGSAPTQEATSAAGGYQHALDIRPAFTGGGRTFVSGTFTLTIFSQTTAPIAYNASVATVQAALNALSNVSARGGITLLTDIDPINATPNHIYFRGYFQNDAITVNSASLTPSGASGLSVRTDYLFSPYPYFGRTQSLTFVGASAPANRDVGCPGHGITTADSIFVRIGSSYFFVSSGQFSVPDANTIRLTSTAGAVYSTAGTITEIGRRVREGYSSGSLLVRAKEITNFYLPGVTDGISSVDDIPRPTYEGDDTTFLEAILSGQATINYQVGDLSRWKDSTILSLTILQLNADDL